MDFPLHALKQWKTPESDWNNQPIPRRNAFGGVIAHKKRGHNRAPFYLSELTGDLGDGVCFGFGFCINVNFGFVIIFTAGRA